MQSNFMHGYFNQPIQFDFYQYSHEQNKRTLQRYFNFLTSARAFKC